ncbi:MAG: cadherin-like domain-containing protein, partial [Rhodanobacter sp.]
LAIAFGALTLSGCPGSNYSNPSLASPQTPGQPSTPPVVAAPPPDQGTSIPPVTPTSPAAPSTVVAPPAVPPPTATDSTLATTMGTTKAGTLVGAGTGALTYAIIVPTVSGTTTLMNSSTGAFTYTPAAHFSGTDKLQFTVTDSAGTSNPATVTITVAPPSLGALTVSANIGVNTDWVCYWCTAQPFVNMVRESGGFGALAKTGQLDANGWPMADFNWMIVCCIKSDGSAADPGDGSPLYGSYQLSFSGQAKLGPLSLKIVDQQYDAQTNTTTATLNICREYQGAKGGLNNVMLSFSKTQRTTSSPIGSGVTNIRVIRPQFAPNGMKWWDTPDQEFTNPFLDSFKGFSTIRSMNWTSPIGSPEVNWSDRTPGNWPAPGHSIKAAAASLKYLVPQANCTTDCDWYGTGMSWESAIDLANATHTDMWINIPTLATDDYVKSLAGLIKSKLASDLHVYVEWTDEIWNYGNPYWTETNYNNDQLKALRSSNPTADARYTANCAGYAAFQCHVAERLKQFGDDFATVYGPAAITTTIRPVLCGQVVQPVMVMEALRYIAKTYGPPSRYFYGTCGAPYWGKKVADPTNATADDVVAAMNAGIPDNVPYIEAFTALNVYYGLHHLSYEGGPSMSSAGVSAEVRAAADLAPGMQANVTTGLVDFFRHGGDMYMYYSSMGSGNWGATMDPLNLAAPKYAGMRAAAGQTVTRAAGTALPGTIVMAKPAFALRGGAAVPTYEMRNCWAPPAGNTAPSSCGYDSNVVLGDGYGYLVTVPQSGTYNVSLGVVGASRECQLGLTVEGKSAGSFVIPATPSGTTPTAAPLGVNLDAGMHVVALVNANSTGSCTVHNIDFSRK